MLGNTSYYKFLYEPFGFNFTSTPMISLSYTFLAEKSREMINFSRCIMHTDTKCNTKFDYDPDANTYAIYNIFNEDFKEKITDYIYLVESNSYKKLSHFLKSDFDPSVLNNLGLRIACKKGYYGCVKQLLCDKRVNPNDLKNEALSLALIKGHIGISKLLLSHLNICSELLDDLQRMFIHAAPNSHLLDLLLRHFAHIYTKGNYEHHYNIYFPFKKCISYTLRSLIKNNHIQVVEKLIIDKIISNQSAIKICIEHGNLKLIKEFSNGSDIDNHKLLIYATKCNSKIEIIRFLLKKLGTNGCRNLTLAIDKSLYLKNNEVFTLLVSHQQDYLTNYGKSAVKCCVAINCVEILEFLLNNQMPGKHIDYGEHLSTTCSLGHEQIFKILLPISDDKYIDNNLFYCAIEHNKMEIVELLIPMTPFNEIKTPYVKQILNDLKCQKILQTIAAIFTYSKIELIKDVARKIIYLLIGLNNLVHLIHLD